MSAWKVGDSTLSFFFRKQERESRIPPPLMEPPPSPSPQPPTPPSSCTVPTHYLSERGMLVSCARTSMEEGGGWKGREAMQGGCRDNATKSPFQIKLKRGKCGRVGEKHTQTTQTAPSTQRKMERHGWGQRQIRPNGTVGHVENLCFFCCLDSLNKGPTLRNMSLAAQQQILPITFF